jgi:hypothetical protein
VNDFAAMLHSSLSCAGTEVISTRLQTAGADFLAHVGIASVSTILVIMCGWPVWLLQVGLGLVVAKELMFDMPNGGWGALVVIDSFFDVVSWLAGFLFVWWAFMRPVQGGAA